jgi:hypothetical protein
MDLLEMIQKSVSNLDNTRKVIKENSGYNVQYLPCGHAREIRPEETILVAEAKEWCKTHLDALIQSSEDCPECESYRQEIHFW